MKKLCNLFFYKKIDFSTKDTMLMSELLPNENGFKGKSCPDVKIVPFPKLQY